MFKQNENLIKAGKVLRSLPILDRVPMLSGEIRNKIVKLMTKYKVRPKNEN